MIASIVPEPKGSSKTKEGLFFAFMAVFILFVLSLPSIVLIVATRTNPSLKTSVNTSLTAMWYQLIGASSYSQHKPQVVQNQPKASNTNNTQQVQPQQPSNTANNTQVSITQSITDVYANGSNKLTLQTYPAECNVGKITGDYVQFNSVKCYTQKDIELLRGFMQHYFSPSFDADYKQNSEQTVLRIISRGTPYPPVIN